MSKRSNLIFIITLPLGLIIRFGVQSGNQYQGIINGVDLTYLWNVHNNFTIILTATKDGFTIGYKKHIVSRSFR